MGDCVCDTGGSAENMALATLVVPEVGDIPNCIGWRDLDYRNGVFDTHACHFDPANSDFHAAGRDEHAANSSRDREFDANRSDQHVLVHGPKCDTGYVA